MPEKAISRFTAEVRALLGGHFLCGYLYGSTVLGDFQPGWSDIDVLFSAAAP